MFKISKNKALLLLFLKAVLLAVVLYFCWIQVRKIDFYSFKDIGIKSWPALIFTILLVSLNLFFEYLKWNNTLKKLSLEVRPKIKFASFMSGNLTAFLTPNLLGNFIGRLFYFQREKRIAITFLSLVSNGSQLLVSILFGLVSIFLIGLPNDFDLISQPVLYVILLVISLIALLTYFQGFNISAFVFKRKKWMKRVLEDVKHQKRFLLTQLIFSLLRNLVFTSQYCLLLLAFGMDVSLETLCYVWQIFFWSTLIPSLWFGKLFIRESVALWIMVQVTDQTEIVLLSSVVLWLINQGVPALVGVPYLKISQKKDA